MERLLHCLLNRKKQRVQVICRREERSCTCNLLSAATCVARVEEKIAPPLGWNRACLTSTPLARLPPSKAHKQEICRLAVTSVHLQEPRALAPRPFFIGGVGDSPAPPEAPKPFSIARGALPVVRAWRRCLQWPQTARRGARTDVLLLYLTRTSSLAFGIR